MPPKKGSKKKGAAGKGKGPPPDASYEEWLTYIIEQDKANAPPTNLAILEDMIDTTNTVPRDYLLKNLPEEKKDPEAEKAEYDKIKVEKVCFKKVVCYYFAGLRQDTVNGSMFTPDLITAYENAKNAGKYVEIVYVSFDKKRQHFDEMFATMPWYAIPWADPQIKHLTAKYKINNSPALVIVGQDAKTVTVDGVKKFLVNANQFPFVKAMGDNVVEMSRRRPNPYPCTVDGCKCKKFEGGGTGKTTVNGEVIQMPVLCAGNGCAHADVYHIPPPEGLEDPKKKKK